MKPATRNLYAERIDRVVARLQQAVSAGGEPPGLAELAAVAHLSAFHFHRVYRALTGETIGGTVARLRLLRALHLLADGAAPVTGVALAIGYETPQAFARAVRDAFGASPSELRAQPARLADEIARLGRPPAPRDDSAGAALQVSVVSVEPFEVVALRTTGAYDEVDQAYVSLFAWAAEAGAIDAMAGLYGIPHADWRDAAHDELVFDAMLRFSRPVRPPAPMRLQRIGGGQYARVRHVGGFRGIEDTLDRLLSEWLPGSGYALRDAPVHREFLDDPDEVPEALLRTDIHVPVLPAGADA